MGSASLLVVLGCFLAGGSWSILRADHPERGRTPAQWVFAGLLALAAALAIAAGLLRT